MAMGAILFGTQKQIAGDATLLDRLAAAAARRTFSFHGRPVFLLICGELNVLQGMAPVRMNPAAPQRLSEQLLAERALILNPTHTRMGNAGILQAKRRFLSQGGRVYVSTSNWDICGGQKQSHDR